MSQMMFMDGSEISPHKLVENISSLSDPIITRAKELRQNLKKYDFDLNDRFCDVQDLEQASAIVIMPEPLLKVFFSSSVQF